MRKTSYNDNDGGSLPLNNFACIKNIRKEKTTRIKSYIGCV